MKKKNIKQHEKNKESYEQERQGKHYFKIVFLVSGKIFKKEEENNNATQTIRGKK
ncbi:MAG: hypothetical protein JST09_11000 [Bacteroidetes bacterium]|nr:hypothetical protein [Bacteroidota bacterium]MBS1610577.1 hypothetical protein [Bacteroidota bacterium]